MLIMVSILEIVGFIFGAVILANTEGSWKGPQWEITVNGKKFSQGRLHVEERREVLVPVENGTAKVVFAKGSINVPRMAKHVCPKGICTEMGPISKPGESIICMPNKMVVRIL